MGNKLGRTFNEEDITLLNYKTLFPDMNHFYFIEKTQNENEFELYVAHKREDKTEEDFVEKIAVFYNLKIARIVAKMLNKKVLRYESLK